MTNYFESKVSYEAKPCSENKPVKVTESYLIDADSWTEAEAKTIKECAGLKEFQINDIKRSNITEFTLMNNGDKFFRAKIQLLTFDDNSGKEKKTSIHLLIRESDIVEAQKLIVEHMKGTVSDYTVVEVKETNIVSVI